jgi:hypothetical protein
MSDQNVCPVCGYKLEVGTYETMRTKLYVAVCTVCGTSGPIRGSWIGAKEALAHPAHLMKDKVLVDTKMYELTLSMAHKWERICDGEELADVAGEGE